MFSNTEDFTLGPTGSVVPLSPVFSSAYYSINIERERALRNPYPSAPKFRLKQKRALSEELEELDKYDGCKLRCSSFSCETQVSNFLCSISRPAAIHSRNHSASIASFGVR